MPKGGSVNHMLRSLFTTTSFGEFNRLPSHESINTRKVSLRPESEVATGAAHKNGILLTCYVRSNWSMWLSF
jgi:hypothetical protein